MRAQRLKHDQLGRRRKRIRRRMFGTPERPRLCVSRTNAHITAQIIDDLGGRTLCAASSSGKELRQQCGYGGNVAAAKLVGKAVGEKARELGIEQVCFDRTGRKYHGRIKAVADAAREAGLKF